MDGGGGRWPGREDNSGAQIPVDPGQDSYKMFEFTTAPFLNHNKQNSV